MSIKNRKFNLVLSIGGSCFSTKNIEYRNLRCCSLPFDWFFIKDDVPIKMLSECFKNDFANFMKQENLVELIGDERGNDGDVHWQCKDLYSHYRVIHLFNKQASDDAEYKRCKFDIDRKMKRLYKILEKSDSVMLVVDSTCSINVEYLQELSNTLKNKFNISDIEIHHVYFSADEDADITHDNNIYVHKIKRKRIEYDIHYRSYGWEFLDEVEIEPVIRPWGLYIANFTIINFHKIKSGCSIRILPSLPHLVQNIIYLFTRKVDIAIGKPKVNS